MTARAFLHGIRTGLRLWRLAVIVYALQLGLALTLGMQAYEVLDASMGRSLEIGKLMKQYDHTVFTDFLNEHGASITPLIGQLRWLLLFWLLFSVFVNAGWLYCAAQPEEAGSRKFWQAGAAYFWPFLKINLVYWILATVWTLLALLPAALFFEPAIEHFPSEKYAFWGMALLIVLWLKGLAFLIISSVLSRLEGLQSGKSTGYCVRSGFRMFWKNKVPQSLLFAAFAGLLLLVSAVYWWLDAAAGMQTPVLVLVFFALQQGVMFSRILFRQMWYAAMAKTMLT